MYLYLNQQLYSMFFGLHYDNSYQTYTKDISGYISANTAIRLLGSPNLGDKDTIWFDNIQIECSP